MLHRQLLPFVLCICADVTTLYFSSAAQVQGSNQNDIGGLLPAYAIASSADLLNATQCGRELEDFRDSIDHRILWSLRMLDASGGPKPGFIYGNNFWLGSRTQCQDAMNQVPLEISERKKLNNTRYRNPAKEFPPFTVNYFVAHFQHNTTLQYHVELPNEDVITLGLCLPASCSITDISFILRKIFRDRTLLIGDLYSADFTLIEVRDLKDDHQWLYSGAVFVIGIILTLTWSVMLIGTIYDIFVHQKYLKAPKNLDTYNENNIATNLNIASYKSNDKSMIQANTQVANTSLQQESKIGKVLICFSIYTNTRIIFNTVLQADSLPVIHGLRFIGMCWIIMIHTVFFLMDYSDNKPWGWRMAEGFGVQIISNSTLAVDTYFFLSGFLLAYLYLKHTMDHNGQTKSINYSVKLNEFFLTVLKRFIRLTPPYMLILGIVLLNSTWYGKTSQFYIGEKPQETCAKYWWRNLLYINNLFSRNTMCMSWSWYLSNDMQFFIIGSFLLNLSSIHFYIAVTILGGLLVGSIVVTGYISYIYEYVPTLEEQYRHLDVLYDPPWTRIGPYIIGIIVAYIILKLKKKLDLKKRTVILYWCIGSSCNLIVLFGLYRRNISILTTAFYVALSRTVWAIGIGWIVIACCTKHGGMVNQFLSFKGWVPLSKLTYCAYLVNPFIMHSIRLHAESPVHIDFLPMIALFLGYLTISYFCAYALTLMSETPYVLLTRMFFESRSRKR